jgi:hypothetical protein
LQQKRARVRLNLQ